MEKDFKSRFKPNVKFYIPNGIKNFVDNFAGQTTEDGCSFSFFITLDAFHDSKKQLVSFYEVFPAYIPDGMRYNKELDKLVPDVIEDKKSAADEYFTGIDLRKKEIIKKRENGFIKADLEKLDFSLVDPFAYSDLAFQLTFGAKKYSKDNWKKGDINIYLSALERHIQDIKKALDEYDIEKLIDDTGIQHGGALLCNSMFIHYFIRQILKDKNVK